MSALGLVLCLMLTAASYTHIKHTQTRAVSVTGPGEYSTPVNITVGDNPTDTSNSDGEVTNN